MLKCNNHFYNEKNSAISFVYAYHVTHPNGIWWFNKFNFDNRDRKIIEGLSNLTFARRQDGSILLVCRGGVWISCDGVSDDWHQISDGRVYPAVKGEFEDPVVWRYSFQYHLIVNDWLGRSMLKMTSTSSRALKSFDFSGCHLQRLKIRTRQVINR